MHSSTTLQITARGAGGGAVPTVLVPLDAAFEQRYELGPLLGAGAAGSVYRALDRQMDRPVAIKIITRMDDEARERFLREGRLLARINHTGVVRIHDLGFLGAFPYLVLELVEGGTLRQRLSAGRLPVDMAVDIALQCLDALSAIHTAGIVHRDLKPDNVLLTADEAPRISDLGVSRADAGITLTATGALIGTPLYMAPEQVRGEKATAAADIWAMGLLLFEMLSGATPFRRQTLPAVLDAILTETAPRLGAMDATISPGIERVVAQALEKAPEDRPASAAEFRALLQSAVTPARARQLAVPARRALAPAAIKDPVEPLPAWMRAALVMVCLIGTSIVAYQLGRRAPPAKPAPPVTPRSFASWPPGTVIGNVATRIYSVVGETRSLLPSLEKTRVFGSVEQAESAGYQRSRY